MYNVSYFWKYNEKNERGREREREGERVGWAVELH